MDRGNRGVRGSGRGWMRHVLTPVALLVLAGVATSGLAAPSAADDDALQGPQVKDRSMPGETRKFAPGTRDEKGARMQERGLPHMAFAGAMRWLGSEQAPADVRLSDDQKTKVKSLQESFRAEMKAYVQQHEAELDTLADQLPPRAAERLERFMQGPGPVGNEDGGEKEGRRAPRGMDRRDGEARMEPPANDAQKAALERVKELMDGAPKPTEAHAQIAALLSDAQKKALEAKVQEIQSTIKDRMGDRSDRRERVGKAVGQLTPEEREKFKAMSPEERQKALQARRAQRVEQSTKGQKPAPAREPK